jgi:hypothetical protein
MIHSPFFEQLSTLSGIIHNTPISHWTNKILFLFGKLPSNVTDEIQIYFELYQDQFISSCHHGMARPQGADEDCIQIRKVAVNILYKQSRTDNRGWSSSLGVGQGANNPPTIKPLNLYYCFECAQPM